MPGIIISPAAPSAGWVGTLATLSNLRAMASLCRMLLVLVCLWSMALAQDDPVITINTEPPCDIYDGIGNKLGQSGQPLILPFQQYGEVVELHLQREHFQPEVISLSRHHVSGTSVWPKSLPSGCSLRPGRLGRATGSKRTRVSP